MGFSTEFNADLKVGTPFEVTLVISGKDHDGRTFAVSGDEYMIDVAPGVIFFEEHLVAVETPDPLSTMPIEVLEARLTFRSIGGFTKEGAHILQFIRSKERKLFHEVTVMVSAVSPHPKTDIYAAEPAAGASDPADGIPPLPEPILPPSKMIESVTLDEDPTWSWIKRHWLSCLLIVVAAIAVIGTWYLFSHKDPNNNATVWTKGSVEAAKKKVAADKVRKEAERAAFDKQQAELKATAEAKALAEKQKAEAEAKALAEKQAVEAAPKPDASSATDEDATNATGKKKKKSADDDELGPQFVNEAPGHI